MNTNTIKNQKENNYMKKLLFATVVSAAITGTLFAEDATKGVLNKNLKLGDSLYTQDQADELMKPYRQKTNAREDTFYVTYQHEVTMDTDQGDAGDIYTNDVGKILQSFALTTTYTFSAYLTPSCDEGYLYEPFTYTCLTTNNNPVMSGNHITVSKPGMYTVNVTDARGDSKNVDVPFSQKADKVIEYVNLVNFTNANTIAAWQEFLTDITNSVALPDLVWWYNSANDQTNGQRKTFRVPFAWTNHSLGNCFRGGNVWPNALTPHVMCCAWHYTWSHWWSGTVTLTNKVSGGYFTVHKSAPWVNAREWALANGWTESEVSQMGLGDLALIVIDSGAIPEECCPYLTSEETLIELFGENYASDLPGWYWGQDPSEWAFPWYNRPQNVEVTSSNIPQWVRDYTNPMAPFNWRGLIGGDSGRPCIFKWKGQLTVVNLDLGSWSLVRGKGLDVIKAFCAQYGDTVKVMQK